MTRPLYRLHVTGRPPFLARAPLALLLRLVRCALEAGAPSVRLEEDGGRLVVAVDKGDAHA